MISKGAALTGLAVIVGSAPAQAAVTISAAATQNMTCSGGVCAPSASDAVLNVTDLENLLASGNATVTTTGSGVQANNIAITAPFSWNSTGGLTLDAYQSITFSAAVSDAGTGAVSLVTNDGGSDGALTFEFGRGKLDTGAVSINSEAYTMANSVKQLAAAIAANPLGHFALTRDYNANRDGTYIRPPIPISFGGTFNGLGHAISNLNIQDKSFATTYVGLFAYVKKHGSLASVGLRKAGMLARHGIGGLIAGANDGTIINVSASGGLNGSETAGGIAGLNSGTISLSQSTSVTYVSGGRSGAAGGIAGENHGRILLSFATGGVGKGYSYAVGGLVGKSIVGKIENCYASGSILTRRHSQFVGGFAGNIQSGLVTTSYSIGAVGSGVFVGGFTGDNSGKTSTSYWDTETSGQDQGSGDGSETGMTGLTTKQFQSGLPKGFDPAIWAEDKKINNGLPYLINNPPPK